MVAPQEESRPAWFDKTVGGSKVIKADGLGTKETVSGSWAKSFSGGRVGINTCHAQIPCCCSQTHFAMVRAHFPQAALKPVWVRGSDTLGQIAVRFLQYRCKKR